MENKPTVTQRNIKARKITYYILGALETLFVFRLIFKVLGEIGRASCRERV